MFAKNQSGNPNGRPKGSKNKFKLPDVHQMFAERNFNPLIKMIDTYEEAIEISDKISALKELLKYYAHQLKAIDHSGEIDVNIVTYEEKLAALEQQEKEFDTENKSESNA